VELAQLGVGRPVRGLDHLGLEPLLRERGAGHPSERGPLQVIELHSRDLLTKNVVQRHEHALTGTVSIRRASKRRIERGGWVLGAFFASIFGSISPAGPMSPARRRTSRHRHITGPQKNRNNRAIRTT